MKFAGFSRYNAYVMIPVLFSGCYYLMTPILPVNQDPLDHAVYRHRTDQIPYILRFTGQSHAPEWADDVAEYGEACAEKLLDYVVGPRVTSLEEADVIIEFNFLTEFIDHATGYRGTAYVVVRDRYEHEIFNDQSSEYWDPPGLINGSDRVSGRNKIYNTMAKALKPVIPRLRQSLEGRGATTRMTRSGSLPVLTGEPENIAVADLTSLSLSEDESITLTETLRGMLVETRYFQILSRADMVTILEEQKFQRTGACDDTQCLVEMGRLLPVEKIIGGSIGKVGNTYQISLRMVDVELGVIEHTASGTVKGERDLLIPLIQKTGKNLCIQYADYKMTE